MTRWGQVQNTETTNTIHRSNRSNSALSIAPMFNLTTNLLCHKTSQQAATVQQLPSTELCLRIVWLSDGPAPRRWSPVKVSMELWARHMGRHCVVDKIVTFWGREFPFFSGSVRTWPRNSCSFWIAKTKCCWSDQILSGWGRGRYQSEGACSLYEEISAAPYEYWENTSYLYLYIISTQN